MDKKKYKIFKYKIKDAGRVGLQLPKGSRILSAKKMKACPIYMWVLQCMGNELELRVIQSYGTGQDIPQLVAERGIFIDTAKHVDSFFVTHVFDITEIHKMRGV